MNEHLLRTLLVLSAQLSVALLLMLALRALLRRHLGAGTAYAAWLLVPLFMAVAQLPATKPGLVLHRLVIEAPAVAPAVVLPEGDDFSALAIALLAVWMLGVAAVLGTLAVRQRRFMRGLRFDALADHWRGPAGSGPALVGLLRQRLCLPADFEQRFEPAQQALILAHEAVHCRRRDNAWNLLAALVAALQWFNPLAWIAARALRADQELACDEAVLREQPARAHDYARALLEAQGFPLSPGLPWASWRSTHPLVERIAMLKVHAHARRRTGALVLLMLGLLGGGAVHALQSSDVTKPAVRLVMHVQFVQDAVVDVYDQTVELATGQRHVVKLSGDGEFDVTAQPSDKCQACWDLQMHVRQGDYKTAPRLITKAGEKASLKMSDKKGVELQIEMTPRPL